MTPMRVERLADFSLTSATDVKQSGGPLTQMTDESECFSTALVGGASPMKPIWTLRIPLSDRGLHPHRTSR